MSREEFESTLRTLIRSEPFQPFEIHTTHEGVIFVDEPAVAFDGGAGAFIPPDGPVLFFDCEQVLKIASYPLAL